MVYAGGLALLLCLISFQVQAQKPDTAHILFPGGHPVLTKDAEQQIDILVSKAGTGIKALLLGYAAQQSDIPAMGRIKSVAAYLEKKGLENITLKMVVESEDEGLEKDGAANGMVDVILEKDHTKKLAPPFAVAATQAVDTPAAPAISKESIDELEVGKTLKIENLYFVGGRAVITEGSGQALDELYTVLREDPSLKINIEGHVCCTSSDGVDGLDLATGTRNLSEMRAKAVYDYLVARGIDPRQLSYEGKARTMPVIRNEREEWQAEMNRRVEIRLLSK